MKYTHMQIYVKIIAKKRLHAQFWFFDPSYNMQSRHNLLVPLLISILLQF